MSQTNISYEEHISHVKEVLELEGKAILNLKDNIGSEIEQLIGLILACPSRVIITGIGKSGIIGRKISATLSSTGTPSFFLHPAEGLHGDLGMVTQSDIIIAISNSGETEEILNILPSLKKIGTKLVAVVGNKNSLLAKKSDLVLSTGEVEEACPLGLAPTTSTTVTLALGDAISIALLKARKFTPENFALFHPGGSLGRQLLLTVEDVVQGSIKNPKSSKSFNVKEVLFIMTTSGLGAISIVDASEKLIGILTDGDIRRALTINSNILETPIEKLYNPNPVVITRGMLAIDALKLMKKHRINVLPIVNGDRTVYAMIHMHDLTRLGL